MTRIIKTDTAGSTGALRSEPPPVRRRETRTERWKHLLRPPVSHERMSVDAFVDELNRRWAGDRAHRADVRFVVLPATTDGRLGKRASWEGPQALGPLVFRLVQGAAEVYAVDTPFVFDR